MSTADRVFMAFALVCAAVAATGYVFVRPACFLISLVPFALLGCWWFEEE